MKKYKNTLQIGLLACASLVLSACTSSYYKDQILPPTDQEVADSRQIKPRGAIRDGVFHMQRADDAPTVRLADNIQLKRPNLPPFDVVYTNRNVESVVLELANVAGESVVLPEGLRNRNVTVIHSGADFQEMMDIVLSKVGYHYNYVNGVWYVTRYPIRNYILEVSQSNRKGSLISPTEQLAAEAEDAEANSDATDITTDYEDDVWTQVEDTLEDLVLVGQLATAQGRSGGSSSVSQNDFTQAENTSDAAAALSELLPPPSLTGASSAQADIFASLTQSGEIRPDSLPNVEGNEHLQPEEDAEPWYRVTKSAGIITVRAAPEAHRLIEEYLGQIQETSNRQIYVEARIVAIVKDRTTDTGSNFTSERLLGDDFFGTIGFGSRTPLTTGNAVGGTLRVLQQKTGSDADLDAVLQALSTVSDVYTISSPSVLARNNQLSRVSITRQLGYAETEVDQSTTSTGDVVIGSRTDTAKFKNAGTVMTVFPFIGKNKVQLRFRLSVASQSGSTEIQTVVGVGADAETVTNEVPNIANNIIDQDMVVDYGRIYAIGGLMESSTGINKEYMPMLNLVPGLSDIIQRATNNKQNTEFVVLLRVGRS
ncbi:MAG: hypothetical protein VX730_03565 [Pseudomonadota bacterium]|nr:hypothetical protein [Pseudomonadota bacterium]